MSQPKVLNNQLTKPGLLDGAYGWNDLTAAIASGKTITATVTTLSHTIVNIP